MIRGFEYINNSHCKVYLPFVNSATENKANGASHIVTNNGVAIRTLSDYSIPDCPNGAKKAGYFDGSSYLTIPYSDDFDYFGKQPLTYRFWVYLTDYFLKSAFCSIYRNEYSYFEIILDSYKLTLYHSEWANTTLFSQQQNDTSFTLNNWYLCELTIFDTRGGNGYFYNYVNGIGKISTNGEIKTTTAINELLNIGNDTSIPDNKLEGYMSEFQIFKGLARPRPGTYNPTNNQRYYTLPTKML